MSDTVAVRVDSKGRLTLPQREREALGLIPGSTVFIQREGDTLRLVKASNPFDALAQHAIAEYRAGRTRSLREIAQEEGIDLNDEGSV